MSAANGKDTQLLDLPPEILGQIISHAPRAQFLRNLSLTCRLLYRAVQANGWAAFVKQQFPSIECPAYWKDAAHALTTLTKNLDRRSCIVEDIGPFFRGDPVVLRELPSGKLLRRWNRPGGQTMGYQPVIDSREEWHGSWDARKEVVVWGAGADVVARVVERHGSGANGATNITEEEQLSSLKFDPSGSSSRFWLTYRGQNDWEGRDDVISINLLNPGWDTTKASLGSNDIPEAAVDVVVGRASKRLELLRLWRSGAKRLRQYETRGLSVRAADVSQTHQPLLGACLGDAKVALYAVDSSDSEPNPMSETACVADRRDKSRSWSARFLCQDKLAIGRGISHRIVYVYSVRPDGLSQEPIRAFAAKGDDEADIKTSAYPIVSVPESLDCSEELGTLFFSGGYDGLLRLHDMRSPLDCVSSIADSIEQTPIFSLAMVGRERLMAGTARHQCVKIYDLRMTGGRVYSRFNLRTSKLDDLAGSSNGPDAESRLTTSECSMYMTFCNPVGSTGRRRPTDSPIYSLSRPSASSTSLYVGMENTVAHANFTDPMDRFPDPMFRPAIVRLADGRIDANRTYGSPGSQLVNIFTLPAKGGAVMLRQFRPDTPYDLYKLGGYYPDQGGNWWWR